MATYNQIYGLTNKIAKMALGEGAITAVDTQSFVSLGKQILSTEDNLDAFYKVLPDQIGRIVSRYQQIKRRTRDIERTPLDFGIALLEIEVDEIARAKENRAWKDSIVNGWATTVNSQMSSGEPVIDPTTGRPVVDNIDGTTIDVGYDDTKISTSIYHVIAGWEVTKLVYDRQLRTGFQNEAQMAQFYNLIFRDMYNGMTLALNDAEMACEGTAIAQEIYAAAVNSQKTAVNLIDAYNKAFGLTGANAMTVAKAKYNADFIKWANYKMETDVKKAGQVSNLYTPVKTDNGNVERELGAFRMHVLADWATMSEYYLLADTYHENFVRGLGGYSEVVCWQNRTGDGSTTEDDSFETNSAIDVVADFTLSNDPANAVEVAQGGVIAHVFADGRMISMIDDLRTKSQYNAIGERTVYAHRADIGYAIRPKEIGITYYLADENWAPSDGGDGGDVTPDEGGNG